MLKIAWSPVYAHSLPPRHRFPMEKYTLLPEQLRYEGTVTSDNFFIPTPLSEKYIINTHDQVYWHKLKNLQLSRKEERATGFPLSKALIHREIVIAQGTVTATEYALQHGVAMNIAGGTHHAFTNKGEGFCLLNDIAIAANYALEHYHFRQILVIDLDVHQGNGTAEIFQFQPKVFTFSMHGAKNYPLRKEKSDLDIGLPDKTGDDIYLPILAETLNTLFHQLQPDLVYFQAGVDVLATDQLGRLALSLQGCRQRDELVLTKCCQHRVPVVVSMGGGYSKQIAHILEAHANTYRLVQKLFF